MGKVSITINGSDVKNIYPAITIGVSTAASDDEVLLFVLPSRLPAFVKGQMEVLNEKGVNLSDLIEMMDGLQMLGAGSLICELGFGVHGIKEENLIESCEVVDTNTFVAVAQGSDLTFSF